MSIKSQLQEKTVAMAEMMAERARTPQEIETIRQRLVAQIQAGTIRPYIGVPLVEDLTRRITEVKQRMAQAAMGAGAPPPAQGGAPIAEQVMARAQQPGIDNLSSNLPQSYAPGGLVAFEEGGEVERYQSQGLVQPASPIGRAAQSFFTRVGEDTEAAKLRGKLQAQYGPRSAVPGLFMAQTDLERETAKRIIKALPDMTLPELRALESEGISALPKISATRGLALPVATATPLGSPDADFPSASRTGQPTPPAAATPPAPRPGSGPTMPAVNTSIPTIKERTIPQVTLEGVDTPPFIRPQLETWTPPAAPALEDLKAIVSKAPKDAKDAMDEAVRKETDVLTAMNAPIEQKREARLAAREAATEKDAAVNRALGIISLGFGVGGSKERTLAGALGNEGRQGIDMIVRGEAANRVARDKLEDAKDAFEQQKLATRKGDRATAMAAGRQVSDDMYKYAALTLTAAQAGNSQALQQYATDVSAKGMAAQMKQTGELGIASMQQGYDLGIASIRATQNAARAQLEQGANIAGAQLGQSADIARANITVELRKLASDAAYRQATLANQSKQLELEARRFDLASEQNKARMAMARTRALQTFMTSEAPLLEAQLRSQYGDNWRTGRDARSLEAQQVYNARRNQYILDAMGDLDSRDSGARSADDLLGRR